MKKILLLLCILAGSLSLTACNPKDQATVVQALAGSTTTTSTTAPPPPPPTTTTTAPKTPPPGAQTACGQEQAFRDRMAPIPCSEIDRAVSEAVHEFGIEEYKFRDVIDCESDFVPTAGGFYKGLTQQSQEFFNRWSSRFNAAIEPDLGAGRPYASREHPFDNARLAAYVIRWYTDQGRAGYTEWGICS